MEVAAVINVTIGLDFEDAVKVVLDASERHALLKLESFFEEFVHLGHR